MYSYLSASSSSLHSTASSTSSPRQSNSPSQKSGNQPSPAIKVGTAVILKYTLPTSSINIEDLRGQIHKETNNHMGKEKSKGKDMEKDEEKVITGFIHAYDVKSDLLFVQEITAQDIQTLQPKRDQNTTSPSTSNTSNNKKKEKKLEFKFTRNSANLIVISRQSIISMQKYGDIDDIYCQYPPASRPKETMEQLLQEQIATLKELENEKMNSVKLDADERANMIFDFLLNLYSKDVMWSDQMTDFNVNINNESSNKSKSPRGNNGNAVDNSKLSIIIMGEVCIDHPYESSSVRFVNGGNNEFLFDRICKVLDAKHWDKAAKYR